MFTLEHVVPWGRSFDEYGVCLPAQEDLAWRIAATCDQVIEQTRQNAHEFVRGGAIRYVEEVAQVCMAAMQTFLDDYESGKRQGRYVDAELPTLPFETGTFHLALCSHVLFLHSTHRVRPRASP
jgi:hypothetical protein